MRDRIISTLLTAFLVIGTTDPSHAGTAGPVFDQHLAIAAELLASDPVNSLAHSRKAVALATGTSDPRQEMQALGLMGQAQMRLGMNAEYLLTSLNAARIALHLNDLRERARVLRELSQAFRLNGRKAQAVEEARNSAALLMPLQDPGAMAGAYLFLMRTLSEAGRHSEALDLTRQLHELCSQIADEKCPARVHHATARVLLDMGKGADALPFLTKAERVLQGATDASEEFQLAADRFQAMLSVGSIQHARIALEEAATHLGRTGDPYDEHRIIQLNYDLSVAMRQWQNALIHLQRLKHLDDSLSRVRTDLNTAGLQVLHQLDSKELDNANLRDINARHEETIAGQRSRNDHLLALSGSFLVLLVVLVRLNRQRRLTLDRLQERNELIHQQHEEIQGKVLELERQNRRLSECIVSEEEKDLVLKEIHHRIKNNLQVIDSMLNLQVCDIGDKRVKDLLKEAQGRVRAMAMVHENIYRGSDGPGSSLRMHLEKLGRSVLVAHGVHDRISISVTTDLPAFTIETMLPLSLILNELLTNSIKHAFIAAGAGQIKIRVARSNEGGYEFMYSDDGAGMELAGGRAGGSFGHELVLMLAHQLNGDVRMEKNPGVAFNMSFTPDRELLRKAG